MLLADLRYAVRRLSLTPGFTITAVLSLALGIGANTALFSLVNAALLRLIPVDRPGELVWFAVQPQSFGRTLNYPFYESLAGDRRFAGLLCSFPVSVNLRAGGTQAERVDGELVSGTYFQTLGLRPRIGRLLSPADDRVRLGHPVAVVSYAYWRDRLGADPAAVGRGIEVNGMPYTLVGVGPPGFTGIEHGYDRSIFVPMKMKPQVTPGWDGLDKPLIAWLWILGRLQAGVDRQALGAEMNARLHAFQQPHLDSDRRITPAQKEIIRHRTVYLEPLREAVLDSRQRGHLVTLTWGVAAVLLMTCANLAGLLLARGLERRREIGTRLALGASRGRVVSQLLAESLVVGVAGGAAGLLLGGWIAEALSARFPLAGPKSTLQAPLDLRVLAFTFVVSLVATVAFGLTPALQCTRLDLIDLMKRGAQGLRQRRLRLALLAIQVAVAMVLLTAAGVFTVNLKRLLDLDTGFARHNMVIAEIEPTLNGYDDAQRLAFYRRLDARLAADTGAAGFCETALSNVAPMSPYYWTTLFLLEGTRPAEEIIPRAVAVGPRYFSTLGIPLRRGRLLSDRDDLGATRVAMISESLARRAFPDSDPIGRHFVADTRKPQESRFEIVGIAADVDLSDPRRQRDREYVYVPYRQWPFVPQAIVIQARLCGETAAAIAGIRRILRDIDPALPLYDIRTIETAVDRLLTGERLVAVLTLFFAALAALLVATGLYGILAREVAMRTREIGIRLALGASRASVLWTVTRGATFAAGLGMAAGALLVTAVAPHPRVALVSAAFLLAVSAPALLLAARRASRLDPAVTLRWE